MFIFSNLAISLDGKISTAKREHIPLGTLKDRREMQRLRRQSDAVIMGAASLRAYQGPCKVFGNLIQPINVILSRKLEGVSPCFPFFKDPFLKRILFITEALPAARLIKFQKTSEVLLISSPADQSRIARTVIQHLENRGIKKILVEGGGKVMWEFVKENLIDEYHVTVTPHLLGGATAPTLVDGLGLSSHRVINLRLKKINQVKSEIYLVYQRLKKRGISVSEYEGRAHNLGNLPK